MPIPVKNYCLLNVSNMNVEMARNVFVTPVMRDIVYAVGIVHDEQTFADKEMIEPGVVTILDKGPHWTAIYGHHKSQVSILRDILHKKNALNSKIVFFFEDPFQRNAGARKNDHR